MTILHRLIPATILILVLCQRTVQAQEAEPLRTLPVHLVQANAQSNYAFVRANLRERAHEHVDFTGPLADLDRAFRLRFTEDRLPRAILEARVLSGETLERTRVL